MSITRRAFFDALSKPELLDITRRCELDVRGKMTKEDLLDRLAPPERAELVKILPSSRIAATCSAKFIGQGLIAVRARTD